MLSTDGKIIGELLRLKTSRWSINVYRRNVSASMVVEETNLSGTAYYTKYVLEH